jgi:hypothetical protein
MTLLADVNRSTRRISGQSGKKKTVLPCHVHQDGLIDAVGREAFAPLTRPRAHANFFPAAR